MNIKAHSKKQTTIDIIYLIIGAWVFAFMLSTSMLSVNQIAGNILGITFISIRLLLIGLTFIDFLHRRQSMKRILILVLFTALVLIEYLVADNWLLFELFFIFIFWADRLNYIKVIKIFMYTTGFSIVLIVLLYYCGFLIKYDYFTNRMGRARVTLGFHHPNSLSECLMVVLLCAFLLYWKKKKRVGIAIATILVTVWIAIFPNTLTVVLTIPIVYCIFALLKLITSKTITKKQRRRILILVGLFVIGIIYGLYYVVNSGMFDNSVLRQFESLYIRIRLSRLGLERYGITLFGTVYESATEIAVYINKTASEYFTIDSVYFLLPIRYGLISSIVFLYCYYKSITFCVKKDNLKLLSVLIAVLVMSVVDPFVTNYIMSFIFICSKAYKQSHGLKDKVMCDGTIGVISESR